MLAASATGLKFSAKDRALSSQSKLRAWRTDQGWFINLLSEIGRSSTVTSGWLCGQNRAESRALNAIRHTLLSWGLVCYLAAGGAQAFAQPADEEFFEKSVRPVLVDRCVSCHGAEKQSGGLRLDSRDALLQGGDGGAVVVLGRPAASRLIQAIRHEDLEMPPDGRLTEPQIAALTHWVQTGAVWPESAGMLTAANASQTGPHWAFQPVAAPQLPLPADASWVRTPIDAFVLSRLEAEGLQPSPEADRRTLIRRLSYTLTGLPPTPEAVEQFVASNDPLAYERLVDRLLDSPHYGEHWARHWLDVARYSDTKGYVYAREERVWVHAWSYRDWVVSALNRDLPYDRFLLLQMAADQVADRRPEDLAAMGFLTLGRRFLGVERDIIDDRIDVVTRGTMGLTVSCARCHDHKYDPIPTADYYSLYGVFDSSREQLVRITSGDAPAETAALLEKRQADLEQERAKVRADWSARVRDRVGDYLVAQTELQKYPPKGFDQIFSTDDILPAFVQQWELYLRDAQRRDDPVFIPWHAYAAIHGETFAQEATGVTERLQADASRINPLVMAAFRSSPATFSEVIRRYAALLHETNTRWKSLVEAARTAEQSPPLTFDDPAAEQLRRVLYGPGAPCEVPDESIVEIESHMDSDACTRLWKLQGEIERGILQAPASEQWGIILIDRDEPREPRIFRRGNPATPGSDVPRQFLTLLSGTERQPFQTGSGRRELAEAIIAPMNPLTARVMVNRVWANHFGAGLVTTPSDFGTRAAPPSHPELLDWLAARFVAEGWSLKSLHRHMLLSSTFRQSSFGPDDPAVRARAIEQDPGNRLLWRMNTHRLTFEEFRDSMLAVGGDLDRETGGKPVPLFESPYPRRRTLYGQVDRQFFPNVLRAFDFANPDLHIPQRLETTVPQQALFVLNHPFLLERARRLAAAVPTEASPEGRVREMYRRTFQRIPSAVEAAAAVQFVAETDGGESIASSPNIDDWKYLYGRYDEESQRVTGVKRLPHFTGSAWQGGAAWPDRKLGWVQLTAAGGHPGNDREHAAVRRWTAPRGMEIRIASQLVHEPSQGDGIRAFIVSSRQGLLASAAVHQQTRDIGVDALTVEPGETIDFVVDIGDGLSHDQYLWNATLTETSSAIRPGHWSSVADFTPDTATPLAPWEQLAQVLLGANEFLFVD